MQKMLQVATILLFAVLPPHQCQFGAQVCDVSTTETGSINLSWIYFFISISKEQYNEIYTAWVPHEFN